jgi:ABC-type branched-subunit amino acid transport system ATPase component
MSAQPIIEMRKIDKHFGAVHALRNIDFHLMPGEILGLVGDNSAGKSTLMKIIYGSVKPEAGQIVFNGGRSAIDCTVKRLSEDGASLAVLSTAGVPERFKLAIAADGFLEPLALLVTCAHAHQEAASS